MRHGSADRDSNRNAEKRRGIMCIFAPVWCRSAAPHHLCTHISSAPGTAGNSGRRAPVNSRRFGALPTNARIGSDPAKPTDAERSSAAAPVRGLRDSECTSARSHSPPPPLPFGTGAASLPPSASFPSGSPPRAPPPLAH
jgi:hypothetical protein